jgi:hypothetical protein
MNPDHPVFRENLARLLTILTQIKPALPDGQWFLNGSAVLYLHDIWTGRPMGDLDVFLATRPWFEFPTELAEPGNQWILNNMLTHNAQMVRGWPCAPIQMVADWKEQKLRAKDAIDVEAIYQRYPALRPSEYSG